MYQAFLVLLHTKNDLPDAEYIHGRFTPGKSERIEVTVRKEHHSKKATKSNHCQKYWPKSCHEMYQQSKIAEEYQCHLPIFLNFTDELGESKIQACNHSSTINTMDRNFNSDCSGSIPCVYTKYRQLKLTKSHLKFRTWQHENADMEFREFQLYVEDTEEHQSSYISVDAQALIAQVGGILGIFFGLSGLNLVEVMMSTLRTFLKIFSN